MRRDLEHLFIYLFAILTFFFTSVISSSFLSHLHFLASLIKYSSVFFQQSCPFFEVSYFHKYMMFQFSISISFFILRPWPTLVTHHLDVSTYLKFKMPVEKCIISSKFVPQAYYSNYSYSGSNNIIHLVKGEILASPTTPYSTLPHI